MNDSLQFLQEGFDNLDKSKPIHLTGIAGSAMSGLARILTDLGFIIIGTDPRAAEIREMLAPLGIRVEPEQDGRHIDPNAQLLIATAAIPSGHPELMRAKEIGIPAIKYAKALGLLTASLDTIAVAGTHGKTTTSTLVVSLLKACRQDPGFVIGAHIPTFGTNASIGKDGFVVEACEFDRSFLQLHPNRAIITNIELDHLDVYKNLDDILSAFSDFIRRLPEDGTIIYSASCPNSNKAVALCDRRSSSFGIDTNATYAAQNLVATPQGTSFDLYHQNQAVGPVHLQMPGRHNVENILAAIAVCHDQGLPLKLLMESVGQVASASRRFEIKGDRDGVTVVDDYAHHPTELRALLSGARQRFGKRRIIVVFQPHQLSRTKHLLDDFADSFDEADIIIIPNIYEARDAAQPDEAVSSETLVSKTRDRGKDATYIPNLEEVVKQLEIIASPGDVILTVGAGNVNIVSSRFLSHAV